MRRAQTHHRKVEEIVLDLLAAHKYKINNVDYVPVNTRPHVQEALSAAPHYLTVASWGERITDTGSNSRYDYLKGIRITKAKYHYLRRLRDYAAANAIKLAIFATLIGIALT